MIDWIENWGSEEVFERYGTGYFIHNNKVIVSWSLSDCSYNDKIAIGMHTDKRYRNKGFGKIVVYETIKDCFDKGYQFIEWLCVDSNKGSIAIAEKLGFIHNNDYYSYSSYPPIENLTDLSESEWYEWGEYLEEACKTEDRLIWDCLSCYIKSNDVEKTINIITAMENKKMDVEYDKLMDFITTLQRDNMCNDFNNKTWVDFINEKVLS